jgi:hypothetical protein
MPHPDLEDLARRPSRYWHIDGLPELMIGTLWIVWGAAWLIGQSMPRDWRWAVYWLVMPPSLALASLALSRATRRLKERISMPRAGYVAWKEPGRGSRVALAAFIAVAALLLAVFVLWGNAPVPQRAPAVLGVILSLSFVAIGIRQHTPHHLGVGAAARMLTLAIASITSGWDTFNWTLVALGTTCAAVGAVRLVMFLRAHPRIAEGL